MDFKELVVKALEPALAGQLDAAAIKSLIETPKSSDLGDYAFPTFSLAKIMHRAPKMIASDLVGQ
ncbi:MAG: arginine--tRNA ligase, partial [Lacticaseibacillus paracasei]|nr:arginine--tRNA ligase [Lacticaseibacillus paracasei]